MTATPRFLLWSFTYQAEWSHSGASLFLHDSGARRRTPNRRKASCRSLRNGRVLSVQKVLTSSCRATRRWPMYFPIRRSLPARPEPDNTFWIACTVTKKSAARDDSHNIPNTSGLDIRTTCDWCTWWATDTLSRNMAVFGNFSGTSIPLFDCCPKYLSKILVYPANIFLISSHWTETFL